MGDPIPQEGPTQSQYSYYRNALIFFGVVTPWVFVYVLTRNLGLVWLSMLNLRSTSSFAPGGGTRLDACM